MHSAIVKYTVILDANGGTGTNETFKVEPGEYELPECTFTAPEGKKFAGWLVGSSTTAVAAGTKITISADVTIKASWEDKAADEFTVTFDSDGGTAVAAVTVKKGEKVSKPADPTKTGYTFKGWKNAEGKNFNFDAPITADVTVKAAWEINKYTVTFNANGGTFSGSKTVTVEYNGTVTKPADPTKTGNTFNFWTADGKTAFDFTTKITKNVTLTANWTAEKRTVTYKLDGEDYKTVSVDYGTTKLEALPAAAEGKKIIGWYTDSNFSKPYNGEEITKDITFYAKSVSENAKTIVNGEETTVDEALNDIKDRTTGNVSVTVSDNESVDKITLPSKGNAEITISGDNGEGTLEFKGAATITAKADQTLTLTDITIAAPANKAVTLTSAKGGLTVEDVTLEGKKATITATKGDLTLGDLNPDGKGTTDITVKGTAKTTATIDGDAEVKELKGFGNLVIESGNTLTIDKTLNVTDLEIQAGATLVIKSGAKMTVKNISGEGTIELESGFNPITISKSASGSIALESSSPLSAGTQVFASKLPELNTVFDISGIAPTDGDYTLYINGSKATLAKTAFVVDGLGEFSDWAAMMTAITNKKDANAVYTITVVGNINIGSSFKLPTKGKYKGIILEGDATITFTGSSISLTGDLELDGVKVVSTKNKLTVKTSNGKYKLTGQEYITPTPTVK